MSSEHPAIPHEHDERDEEPRSLAPRWRWAIRFFCLAAALALLIPAWRQDWPALAVPALSPFIGSVSMVAAPAASIATAIAAPVLLIVLFRRRWLCRYVCPTGLLADLVGRLRRRGPVGVGRWPRVGRWLVWATLGGAMLGYPLFLWLDPLAIFAGFVNAWDRELSRAAWLSAAGLPLVLLISLLRPGLWCARLCPLGAMQELVHLSLPRTTHHASHTSHHGGRLNRRGIIAFGLGLAGATAVGRWVIGTSGKPLRPPGAASEEQFTGLCVRCGNCSRVCPSRILHPDLGQFGVDSFLTPVIRFGPGYCEENCQRCTHVCPSGALRRLTAEEKPRAVIGLPQVDMNVCLLGEDRECSICRAACPYGAIKLVFSETDYLTTPRVDPQRCNGCGACQVRCPTKPIKAIVVAG